MQSKSCLRYVLDGTISCGEKLLKTLAPVSLFLKNLQETNSTALGSHLQLWPRASCCRCPTCTWPCRKITLGSSSEPTGLKQPRSPGTARATKTRGEGRLKYPRLRRLGFIWQVCGSTENNHYHNAS